MQLSNYHNSVSRTTVTRHFERCRRRKLLIDHLLGVTYLGSLEAHDTPVLSERCRLARLIQGCDQVLRQLRNKKPGSEVSAHDSI
jgi:hypothetical protein